MCTCHIMAKDVPSTVFQKVAGCDHILKYSNCGIAVLISKP